MVRMKGNILPKRAASKETMKLQKMRKTTAKMGGLRGERHTRMAEEEETLRENASNTERRKK